MPPRKTRKSQKTSKQSTTAIVKSAISRMAETKYNYAYSSSTTVDQTGVQWPMTTAIGQGVTSADRVGADITMLYLDLGFRIARNPTTPSDGAVRVIVYVYKSKSAAGTPALGQILKQTGTIYSVVSSVDHKVVGDEARVLFDKSYSLIAGGSNVFCVKKRFNLKGLKQQLDSTGYGTNTIYVYAVSDNTTNPFVMHWYSALAYKDM